MPKHNPDLSDLEVKEEEFVKTAGMNSTVLRFPENGEEPIKIGHTLMVDTEMNVFELPSLRFLLAYIEGVSFIFKSSDSGYHVYNPVVKSLYEIKEMMDSIQYSDSNYVDAGYNKGSYTLRVAEKGSKETPEPLGVVYGKNHKEIVYSQPHLEFLEEKGFNEAVDIMDNCKTVGHTVELVSYFTRPQNHMLDDMKQVDDLK